MTTAHRPTFDPARGKEALRGPAYHQRLQPAHTQLKFRKPGQGGDADDRQTRDLRAELLAAEAAHCAKLQGRHASQSGTGDNDEDDDAGEPAAAIITAQGPKRLPPPPDKNSSEAEEENACTMEAKRRRILEMTREMDADDNDDEGGSGSGGSEKDDDDDEDSEEDDSEDEDAELARELERVRRERMDKREREVRERFAAEQNEREQNIAKGNPLLNKPDFNIKRRWDDDVVFKNQARGTEDKNKKKEFVNDLLRSDFHKRFMSKYVR